MKTFLDLARERRSIRRYQPKPVEREKIERCLEAARLAPSACNSQPWTFVAVSEPQQHAKLAAASFGGIYAPTAFAAQAPLIVAIVADKGSLATRFGNMVRDTSFYLIDIGIACGHFALAAADEGLGACIIGWFDEKGAAKALGIPPGKKVELLIACGYPDETPDARPRREFKDVCRFDKF